MKSILFSLLALVWGLAASAQTYTFTTTPGTNLTISRSGGGPVTVIPLGAASYQYNSQTGYLAIFRNGVGGVFYQNISTVASVDTATTTAGKLAVMNARFGTGVTYPTDNNQLGNSAGYLTTNSLAPLLAGKADTSAIGPQLRAKADKLALDARLPFLLSASEFATATASRLNYENGVWAKRTGTAPTVGLGGIFRAGPAGSYYERLGTGGTWQVDWFGAVGDSTANDTDPINTAISHASQWATARSARIRLRFREDAVYLTDGVLVKANIDLEGRARLKKRTDGGTPSTNSLIRAVPVLLNGSYYGTYKNIRIRDLALDQGGKVSSANLVSLWFCENLEIENVTVRRYADTWAFSLGGRNVSVRGCTILGGNALFEDGIHFLHGRNLSVSDCYVESGDDAIALGTDPVAYINDQNEGIDGVTVSNCRVRSTRAYGVSIYAPTDAGAGFTIRNVTVSNVSGSGGLLRNGFLQINDKSAPALGSGRISDIVVTGLTGLIGSTAHDDTNPVALTVTGAQRVKISNGAFSLTNGTGAATGFRWIGVVGSVDVTLENLSCPALTTREALYVSGCQNVEAYRLTAYQTSAATTAAVTVASSPGTVLEACRLLNVKSGQVGIDAGTGTTNTLYVRNSRIAHAAGASNSYAVNLTSSSVAYLQLVGNDFSAAAGVLDGSSVNQKFPVGTVKALPAAQVGANRGATYEGDASMNNAVEAATRYFGYASALVPPVEFLGGASGTGVVRFRRTAGVSTYFDVALPGTGIGFQQSGSTNVFNAQWTGSQVLIVAGSNRSSGTPVAGIFSSEGVASTLSNTSGGDAYFRSGPGSGNAAASTLYLQTPNVGSSGTTVQTMGNRLKVETTQVTFYVPLILSSLPTYADNAAATTGGLVVGAAYKTSTGQLMIRY